jgi:predicted DNA-binding transcriptional regulator YafY
MTLLRQWAMLQEIPREPLRKSTTQIFNALRDLEYEVDKRTVQRDLARLAGILHYTSESSGRAELWFWPKDAKLLDLPAMDAPLAVSFLLFREHLASLVPPATLKLIGPYFSRAEDFLRETPGALAAWRSRVCVLSRGPRLQTPKVTDEVQADVYQAVLEGKRLQVRYRPRAKDEREYVLNPFGLVVFDGVVYLIASTGEHQNPVMWLLHRMKSVTRLNEAARPPKDFDLSEYARKEFGFPMSDAQLKLVLRLSAEVAAHLAERPLSPDQQCTPVDDEVELTATVADTEDLRWWIMGFGDGIEVIKPAKLRMELKRRLVAAAGQYDQ